MSLTPSVACPACGQMATHHIGQQVTRPESDERVQIGSWAQPALIERPVDPGGTYRERTCLFCGRRWQQPEQST